MSEPRSKLVQLRRKTFIFASRSLFLLGIFLLVSLLILQLGILYLSFSDVPAFAMQRLQEELREEGLDVQYSSLRFLLPNTISVTDFTVSSTETGEEFARITGAQIRLSPFRFLQDKSALKTVILSNATIVCPPSLSPSGNEEPLVTSADLTLKRDVKSWKLESLSAKIGNLFASGSGELPVFPKRPKEPEIDWQKQLKDLVPKAVEGIAALKQAKNPVLRLRFERLDDNGLSILAEAWSEVVVPQPDLIFRQPRISARLVYDGFQWQSEGAEIFAREIVWDQQILAHVHGLRGKFFWPKTSTEWMPERAEILLNEFSTEAGSFHAIRLDVAADGLASIDAKFAALFENGPIEAEARLDGERGNGELKLRTRINPTSVLQHELARQFKLRRDLFFMEPIHGVGEASFKNWDIVKATARAHTRNAHIDGVFLDQAWADVVLTGRDKFRVSQLILKADDFEVTGSYDFDIPSKEYRFLFSGSLRPLHISPWFRSWWVSLWESFSFPGPPLRGDVDIHSVLGRSEEVQVFGSATAEDFFLRGVPISSARLKLFVVEDYADIFEMEVERTEGRAIGGFRYWADPETSDLAKVSFQVESSLDLTDVAQVFGPAGSKVLSDFRFSVPPHLVMAGNYFGPPRENETRIGFSARTHSPLLYAGIPLDSLAVDGYVEGEDVILPEINGKFAGGVISGYAQKWTGETGDQLQFATQIEDADVALALEAVEKWQQRNGKSDEEKETAGSGIGGVFDLNLSASGLYGEIESYSGEGNVKIRDADLAEIHLLGLLSRILSATPLGFTSLQFDQAEADFQIEREKLVVSDLSLTSSTSAISGSGEYVFTDDTLDFLIKLHFMRKSKIPFLSLLLAPVLEPLAHVMEVRLTGSMSKPEWRFLLGPRNILSGISTGPQSDEPPVETENP